MDEAGIKVVYKVAHDPWDGLSGPRLGHKWAVQITSSDLSTVNVLEFS